MSKSVKSWEQWIAEQDQRAQVALRKQEREAEASLAARAAAIQRKMKANPGRRPCLREMEPVPVLPPVGSMSIEEKLRRFEKLPEQRHAARVAAAREQRARKKRARGQRDNSTEQPCRERVGTFGAMLIAALKS